MKRNGQRKNVPRPPPTIYVFIHIACYIENFYSFFLVNFSKKKKDNLFSWKSNWKKCSERLGFNHNSKSPSNYSSLIPHDGIDGCEPPQHSYQLSFLQSSGSKLLSAATSSASSLVLATFGSRLSIMCCLLIDLHGDVSSECAHVRTTR